jgi:long-chain acyl-CoA synthetase
MTMSYEEATQQMTGPGSIYEITEAEVHGQRLKVFKNTPPSMRALFDGARAKGDDLFLVYEDEEWSFTRTMEHADALGALLVDRYGVKKGDTVAIAMRNYPEWITGFAAITSIGAIAVSMNAWWTPDEMAYGLEDSGAKVMIADRERIERAADAMKVQGVHAVAVRAGEGALPDGADRLEEVIELGQPMPAVEIDLDDDATILYTSGTTGFPKGAVSTHRAVLSALVSFGARAAINNLRYPSEREAQKFPNCFILTVPLFHVTGCVAVMMSCFVSGAKLVMMYKWNPERALELIERERVTNFVGVPTMSWDLLESPDFERRDTTSLVSVGGGGAPAPPELVKRVDSGFKNGRPGIGYGMTETNAYGPQNAGDDYVANPTSSGRCVPTLELRVTDPDGTVLGTGEVGEIWFRGPNVIRGYWNKPEATAETISDGWLRSGDIGRINAEGFIFVVDRAKDMVLRGGENVYCAEVEAAIYEHPAVYEAAVFGLPHERLGEEVACSIFLKEGETLDEDSLKMHVAERLANFKVPSQIRFSAEQLPRNAAGKILKREIRDSWAAEMA